MIKILKPWMYHKLLIENSNLSLNQCLQHGSIYLLNKYHYKMC